MTRATLVRPPTEQITDSDGKLTEEWSRRLDEVFLYLGEQQNTPTDDGGDTGGDTSTGLTEAEVQALIDASLSSYSIVRRYEEYIASPTATNVITHNLGDTAPLVTFYTDDTPGFIPFMGQNNDENSITVRFSSTPTTDLTVVVWSIEPES